MSAAFEPQQHQSVWQKDGKIVLWEMVRTADTASKGLQPQQQKYQIHQSSLLASIAASAAGRKPALSTADFARLCTAQWPLLNKVDLACVILDATVFDPTSDSDSDEDAFMETDLSYVEDLIHAKWPRIMQLRLH